MINKGLQKSGQFGAAQGVVTNPVCISISRLCGYKSDQNIIFLVALGETPCRGGARQGSLGDHPATLPLSLGYTSYTSIVWQRHTAVRTHRQETIRKL